MKRRMVKRRESLAILPEALHSGPQGIWWDELTPVPDNERCGTVAIVHVRGSLEHHLGFGHDSYEGIFERVRAAFEGTDEDEGPPSAVVLRIDSPGGVVSGLNQTVRAIRALREQRQVPLIAYVDELAASAAYALACACDEIYLPPSAIAGSVGVISTMFDQVAADEAMGINFITLTSGARKADGHPHVPVSDEAVAAEQRRVNRLARQFFALVADVRPVSPKELRSYEAGIFLGAEAVQFGLADAVLEWSEFLESLDGAEIDLAVEKNVDDFEKPDSTFNKTLPTGRSTRKGKPMLVALKALVAKTEKRLAAAKAEKDASLVKKLTASLASYKAALEAMRKEKKTIEKYESESDEDEESAESEEDEESEAKGNETDRKQKKAKKADLDDDKDEDDDSEDDDSEDDEEEEDEEDEEEEDEAAAKKAAASILGRRATLKQKKALAELVRKAHAYDTTRADVAALKAKNLRDTKNSLIDKAVNGLNPTITRHEAVQLRGEPLSFVRKFLGMRKGAVVNTSDETVHVVREEKLTGGNGLPADVEASIEQAMSAAPDGIDREKLRARLVEDHKKRIAAGLNGIGRY